jgi:solute carrier family 25 (mitochondrial carnitine/acylcarnitine transporter), member 20/29
MIGGENTSEPTNPTDSLRAILWESCLDITAGSFAGVWSCLSGHSFDTVKVNMQVTNNTLRQTVSAIYREYGLLGYFRGIYYPLVTIPLINAVCFASYEMANRLLQLNN